MHAGFEVFLTLPLARNMTQLSLHGLMYYARIQATPPQGLTLVLAICGPAVQAGSPLISQAISLHLVKQAVSKAVHQVD